VNPLTWPDAIVIATFANARSAGTVATDSHLIGNGRVSMSFATLFFPLVPSDIKKKEKEKKKKPLKILARQTRA
jgi:hypothetical protein